MPENLLETYPVNVWRTFHSQFIQINKSFEFKVRLAHFLLGPKLGMELANLELRALIDGN